MNKRKLSAIAAAVLLAAGMCISASSAAITAASVDYKTYAATPAPSSVLMTYYDGTDSRGFAWITDTSVGESFLDVLPGTYGEADAAYFDENAVRYAGTCEAFTESGVTVNVHNAHVCDLEEGTYSYRVGGGGCYAYGTFDYENDGKVTVLNFNDAQTKDADLLYYWENTVAQAVETLGGTDDVDFVAYGGDLFDSNMGNYVNGKNISRTLRWGFSVDTVSGYIGSLPFVESAGNHESHTPDLFSLLTDVDFAGTTPGNVGGFYSFDTENVHFAVVPYFTMDSSGFDFVYEWLDEDLAAAKANPAIDWTVVQMHWGPYTTGDHGCDGGTVGLIEEFCPLFAEYEVDLVLQAHDHTFSKTVPYLWSGNGYSTEHHDGDAFNMNVVCTDIDGTLYDLNPMGTYYISVGAAGHRIGENEKYASPKSGLYERNYYKIEIGKTSVDSPWGYAGRNATGDLDRTMFGVLNIEGNKLKYDFYVVTDGGAFLYDTLAVCKDTSLDGAEPGKAREYRPSPDPLYGDANADGKVNVSDVTAVLKHIANWGNTIDTVAANANADLRVDLSDAVILLKKLAGWDVTLGHKF